jgi:large subunit ribosomal protein L15
MRLNGIRDNAGAKKTRVRIGRGIGSGMGKMGGRGGKGQTARTGVAIGGFEGGQMPLHRRLPKRGFNKYNPSSYNEINLGSLQRAIDEKRLDSGKDITNASLVEAGILRRPKDGLRLLGDGDLKAKVSITVSHASAKAKAAVEKAGGKLNIIAVKVLAADEAKRSKSLAKKVARAKKPAGGGAAKAAD